MPQNLAINEENPTAKIDTEMSRQLCHNRSVKEAGR